jgi:hypothetical protein
MGSLRTTWSRIKEHGFTSNNMASYKRTWVHVQEHGLMDKHMVSRRTDTRFLIQRSHVQESEYSSQRRRRMEPCTCRIVFLIIANVISVKNTGISLQKKVHQSCFKARINVFFLQSTDKYSNNRDCLSEEGTLKTRL